MPNNPPSKELPKFALDGSETEEIKASVGNDFYLQEAPAPQDIPEPPSPSRNQDFPSTKLHDVQSYQPSFYPQSQPTMIGTSAPELMGRTEIERTQQLAESIIKEKWNDFNEKVGNFELWKEKVDTNIISLKQELIRTQQRFENLEKAVLNKVSDYNKTMESVNTEMKALEKVFEKIIDPLTSSIKELKKVSEELKKK